MKFYLSVDIEGVAGICDWAETQVNGEGYSIYQEQMIQETSACIRAIQKCGNHEIYVRDAHDSARNLIPSRLPSGIKIIRGWEEHPCDMLAGLDASFDACLFIGYHSPSRLELNPLSHTLYLTLHQIKINQNITSEFHLNAYYAESLGVPVIFVSGDEGLTNLVKAENEAIETVSTKAGLHGAVISKHPQDVLLEIEEATERVIMKLIKHENMHVKVPREMDAEITFKKHKQAHFASFYPGVEKVFDDTVRFKTSNINELLKCIMFITR